MASAYSGLSYTYCFLPHQIHEEHDENFASEDYMSDQAYLRDPNISPTFIETNCQFPPSAQATYSQGFMYGVNMLVAPCSDTTRVNVNGITTQWRWFHQHASPLNSYSPYPQHNMQRSRLLPPSPPSPVRDPNLIPQLPSRAPLGPPPKPRSCGHAIWVGNLPAAVSILDLKDFFSQKATSTIESVKLIGMSNCAFVNYATLEACKDAVDRFNGSQYQGKVLVCRVREKNFRKRCYDSPNEAMRRSRQVVPAVSSVTPPSAVLHEKKSVQSNATNCKARYFVMKSLTPRDVETSVQQGVWVTQSHNAEVLDNAFKTANVVYLFFSVNRSGQYCGLARMESCVMDRKSEIWIDQIKSCDDSLLSSGLQISRTPATEFAPAGRVVDDVAHNVVFWEAEADAAARARAKKTAPKPLVLSSTMIIRTKGGERGALEEQKAAFRIKWLSLRALSFHKTRGLRNAWNMNQEIKVARDGTEIEPSAGKRLLDLFHELQ